MQYHSSQFVNFEAKVDGKSPLKRKGLIDSEEEKKEERGASSDNRVDSSSPFLLRSFAGVILLRVIQRD